MEAEKAVTENTTLYEEETKVEFEHEIECPRCHDIMVIYSYFDNLSYVCEECNFCLYRVKLEGK